MWPQHGTHCQLLLLLNVTTAWYKPSTFITFECDHNTVWTVSCYYFQMWPQPSMHHQTSLLLNVTTTQYALSTIITFEFDHSVVRTVNRYYFWMWPQHSTQCQPLLLLNVTTAQYALYCYHSSGFISDNWTLNYYYSQWILCRDCQFTCKLSSFCLCSQ